MTTFSRGDLVEVMAKAPAIRGVLVRLARRAAEGKPLPATFTAAGLDYEAQRMLEGLFGASFTRLADGRLRGAVRPELREPGAWAGVFDVLGVFVEKTFDREEFFLRLSWEFPEHRRELALLEHRPDVAAFLRNGESAARWRMLFRRAVAVVRDGERRPITLSQLGSDWLGDSKSLRSGTLRDQLVAMLGVLADAPEGDDRETLALAGIVDNPYTTHVTVFAPFAFRLSDGTGFDFPATLFAMGLSCQLSLETVSGIASIEWRGAGRKIVTSENAAPFARLVAEKTIALYTEGYPNSAVKGLLAHFAAAGVTADHEGDADLDGFRIAEEVRKAIPVERVVAADVARRAAALPGGISLDEAQTARLRGALEREPDVPYAASLKALEEAGRWFEQESFHGIHA